MNIIWVTVRNLNDFCSTTTSALSNGLIDAGHELILINGDSAGVHSGQKWAHVGLKQSSRRGMKASSLASSAAKWFTTNKPTHIDVVVIDWPLAPRLAPVLNKLGYQITLMDRSPPADASLLGKLQWRVWKRAWNMVKVGVINRGCVVSEQHLKFIQQRCFVAPERMYIISAGVDLELFSPSKNRNLSDGLRLVYHGQLDKHRGVLSLPMLVQKLVSRGIKAQLTLVGDGNAVPSLKNIQHHSPWLNLHGRMSQSDVSALISKQHIGLLPMPETPVWSLASPLKRSEYLASGLLVLGLDHSGHILDDTKPEWYHLLPQHDFHSLGVEWMAGLNQNLIESGSEQARVYASERYSWNQSVNVFIDALYACKQDE